MAADRYEEKPHIWEEKGNWDSLPGQWRFCLPSGGRIPPFAPLGSQSHSKKKKPTKRQPNTEIRYYYFKLLQIWGWQIKMQILMAFLIRRCGSLPTDALQKPDGLFSASANRCWGLETKCLETGGSERKHLPCLQRAMPLCSRLCLCTLPSPP